MFYNNFICLSTYIAGSSFRKNFMENTSRFLNFFNDSPNLLRRHYSIAVISGTLAKITKHSGSNVTASNIKVVLLFLRCSELKGGCSRLSGDLSGRISALFRSRVSFAIRVLGSSSFRGGQESTL